MALTLAPWLLAPLEFISHCDRHPNNTLTSPSPRGSWPFSRFCQRLSTCDIVVSKPIRLTFKHVTIQTHIYIPLILILNTQRETEREMHSIALHNVWYMRVLACMWPRMFTCMHTCPSGLVRWISVKSWGEGLVGPSPLVLVHSPGPTPPIQGRQ